MQSAQHPQALGIKATMSTKDAASSWGLWVDKN
jgi:hypothetical protein